MLTLLDLLITKLGEKRRVLFAAAETLIIIILIAVIIFRKDSTIPPQSNEKALRDSIALSYKKIDLLQTDINRLRAANDSLQNLKTNIQLVYETKIKYIERSSVDTASAFIRRYLKSSN